MFARCFGTLIAVAAAATAAAPAAARDLTIYSSLPLSGPSKDHARAVLRGERLALETPFGGFRLRLVSLDGATKKRGGWTPERVAANARRAASDPSAIGYIGEFDSGATAISLPILNEAGIPQISPTSTAIGLTRGGAGADRGEPEKYYPTGLRTFFRIPPADHVQAVAIGKLLQEIGTSRAFVVHDGEVYGGGVGRIVRDTLPGHRIELVGHARLGRRGRGLSADAIARRIRRSNVDAMVFTGITQNGAARLFDAVHRRNPDIHLVGSDGVAEAAFAGRLRAGTRRHTWLMNMLLAPASYPPFGQDALKRLDDRYGERDPYALYGFAAMTLLRQAILQAGRDGDERVVVTRELARQRFNTTVGDLGFDQFGDSTLTTYGVYRPRRGGALRFDRAVDGSPPPRHGGVRAP